LTELLFLEDCYAREFNAEVVQNNKGYLLLNKTLFYGRSGGQPGDTGILKTSEGKEVKVLDTRKEQGELRHYVEEETTVGTKVHGIIDWERRYKLMKMHTAQHLLSAIILDKYGAETVGNQIHEDYSRVDFKPFKPTQEVLEEIVKEFNKAVEENKRVWFETVSREEMLEKVDEKRRKLFEKLPSFIKQVRLVHIEGIDICPCAGTHVKSTSELGFIKITDVQGKGKETTRIKYALINPV